MKVILKESQIPAHLVQTVLTKCGFDIDETIALNYTTCIFMAINKFMKLKKSKTEPVALEVKSLNGEFLLGACVRYHENEDPEMPGNWSYEYTFIEDDLKDVSSRFLATDSLFGSILSSVMIDNFGYVWNIDIGLGSKLTIEAINVIKAFLDSNVTESEEVELEHSDLFIARAAVEGGEKVMSITPAEKAKIEIKESVD